MLAMTDLPRHLPAKRGISAESRFGLRGFEMKHADLALSGSPLSYKSERTIQFSRTEGARAFRRAAPALPVLRTGLGVANLS